MSRDLFNTIKEKAEGLGFIDIGCVPIQSLKEEKEHLDEYLSSGWHGSMGWITKSRELRLNPILRYPDARSVISLAINYFNEEWKAAGKEPYGRLSRYVYGKDYHSVIKSKLKKIAAFLRGQGARLADYYVDDGPVLEKKWAVLCGIGWRGKNSLIFNERYGSWIFLSEIITDLELGSTGGEMESRCGSCTLCMDACPTHAIEKPFMLNAPRCITYMTAEKAVDLNDDMKKRIGPWVCGCDICQEVCPQNRMAKVTDESHFFPKREILELSLPEILSLDEERFRRTFRGSAMRRGGLKRLTRNASVALDNLRRSKI